MIFARMPYPQQGSQKTSGLLYAAPFGSDYELYYFFPLDQLQNELYLVQRTLALVGLALVFLLAGIAWLVTRWVVVPVARAAQGAQLLSTGKLDERLAVRGQDEVAALATLVQRDGREPAGKDARARGTIPGAAAVRLRRLA